MFPGTNEPPVSPITLRTRKHRAELEKVGIRRFEACWPGQMLEQLDAAVAATGASSRNAMMERVWRDNPDLFSRYHTEMFDEKEKGPSDANR